MHCHLILSLNAEEDLFMVGKYHKYNGEIMECFFFFKCVQFSDKDIVV